MTIQDKNFLKLNSIENSTKIHFSLNDIFLNKKVLDDIIHNMFTVHILDVYLNDIPLNNNILTVYANDNKMDSIVLNQQRNYSITGREYEKSLINPLAKVSALTFKLTNFNNQLSNSDLNNGNISILIRNYEPQTEFNNNFNDLNPQYNPHFIPEDSTSSEEED